MPGCSYCYRRGHTIRTCRDPSIQAELNSYFALWIAPDLILENIRLTDHTHMLMREHIETASRDDLHLIRAISIRYCNQHPTAPISTHIDSIVDRITEEAVHVDQLNEEQREEWCLAVTRMTMWDWQDNLDDLEEEIAADKEETDTKKYPVYDIILNIDGEPSDCHQECAICQEEKPVDRFDKTQCSHSFCHECISTHLETKNYNRASCPLCRADIMSLETKAQQCYDSLYSRFSETGALMKDCLHMWGLE